MVHKESELLLEMHTAESLSMPFGILAWTAVRANWKCAMQSAPHQMSDLLTFFFRMWKSILSLFVNATKCIFVSSDNASKIINSFSPSAVAP